MYEKILIATDGSEQADKALDHGLALAKAVGATVIVVTVTGLWSALEISREGAEDTLHAIQSYEKIEAERAQGILAAASERAREAGVNCEIRHVSDQRPSEGILLVAEQLACDLIVMGTHGRRGVSRMLLGSQANEVVSQSKIPVMVLR